VADATIYARSAACNYDMRWRSWCIRSEWISYAKPASTGGVASRLLSGNVPTAGCRIRLAG